MVKGLVFDEYGSGNNYLKFEDLKRITGGDGNPKTIIASLNRKKHGASFKVYGDVMIIILSNNPPEEVYMNKKTKKISQENADLLYSRFQIIRLDGPREEDINRFVEGRSMNLIPALRDAVGKAVKNCQNHTHSAFFVDSVVRNLIECRETDFANQPVCLKKYDDGCYDRATD